MVTMIDGTPLDRANLLEKLWEFNADAKAISRRGRGAQDDPRYKDCHDSINDALTALQRCV